MLRSGIALSASLVIWVAVPPILRAAELGFGPAVAGRSTSVLSELNVAPNLAMAKSREGLLFRQKDGREGRVQSTSQFKVPLVITAQVKTDKDNIRVTYGDTGRVILAWELDRNQLRYHDPRTGDATAVNGQGAVVPNKWVTVRWVIEEKHTRVEVDGVERAKFDRDYAGLSGRVGLEIYDGAVITLRSLTVGPVPAKSDVPEPPDDDAPVAVGPMEFDVPSAAPATQPVEQSSAGSDPSAIARPEYRNSAKRLVKDLTSVTAMMVQIAEDGQATGATSDIIATVPGQSRRGSKAGVSFARADGDETMKVALGEAVRAVTLRYPLWEPGRIELSFGEKFIGHGGPSAATGFALLMLSMLEGFDLDAKCAVTGDLTVDWKVRPVGGVAAKLRGATLDGCKVAVIPSGNETAFADMALLYGNSAIWDIQVFSATTLQDAIAVARTDRPTKIADAIRWFDELRPSLTKAEKTTLKDPATRTTLERILKLAPNHLSARRVLAMCDGTAPKTLSSNATLYQLSVIFYPCRKVLSSGETLDRTALPAHVTTLARKRLAGLRPMASKDLQNLVGDTAAFVEALDGFAAKRVPGKAVVTRAERIDADFAQLNSDPRFIEKLVREGY